MRDIIADHLQRVKTAVLQRHTAANISKWVCENTTYGGQPYSFDDHEYQERILNDTSQELNVQKCAQVGISEVTARMVLALVNVLRPYTVIYTLHTAKFASIFTKTRIDPVIEGSDRMLANIHKSNDNQDMKQFGESFLYLRGAALGNAPISIPGDHLVHDEVDASDQNILDQYLSRLTHSKWKRITRFSTPTLPGFGINKFFRGSRRYFNFVKCRHCGHQFVPDYYEHVRVPFFTGDLREFSKSHLAKAEWKEAYVECPKCGGKPSLLPEFREWVCENPRDVHLGAGYQVTPFDAPKIITPGYLVQRSTDYSRTQDFVNNSLGLPMEDSEATLTEEDFDEYFISAELPGSCQFVMGVDVGNVYHFKIGAVSPYDDLIKVHTESVPMSKAKERYHQLRKQYNVCCTVMDSAPHAETVMALQESDDTMYASVYTKSKSLETHRVVDRIGSAEEGTVFVRQVNVNRSKAFDAYMEALRAGKIKSIHHPPERNMERQEIEHHCSMKRVQQHDPESGEMAYSWQKTDGIDHLHHAGLYVWIAAKIRGVGRSSIILPLGSAMKFRLRPK